MKLNWGWGIFFVVLIFIVFILNLVYRCSLQRVDLVSDNYYEKELKFQEQINSEANSAGLIEDIGVSQSGNKIEIAFPPNIIPETMSGEITFFKPDNASLDFSLPVKPDHQLIQTIDKVKIKSGWWSLQIKWMNKGIPYYFQKKILIN